MDNKTPSLADLEKVLSPERYELFRRVHDDLTAAASSMGDLGIGCTARPTMAALVQALDTMHVLSGQLNEIAKCIEDEQAAENREQNKAEQEENGAAYGLGGAS